MRQLQPASTSFNQLHPRLQPLSSSFNPGFNPSFNPGFNQLQPASTSFNPRFNPASIPAATSFNQLHTRPKTHPGAGQLLVHYNVSRTLMAERQKTFTDLLFPRQRQSSALATALCERAPPTLQTREQLYQRGSFAPTSRNSVHSLTARALCAW